MDRKQYLAATPLLDYTHPSLQGLVKERGWQSLDATARIRAVYGFVQNEIRFGYNLRDELPASRVLQDGYGQCNTKATLLMALLREVGIPCRQRGLWVHKRLQKGLVPAVFYAFTPTRILHSWAEVQLENEWYALEGVILDLDYLAGVQSRIQAGGPLCGFGVAVPDVASPPVHFTPCDTYIQRDAVLEDLGVFDSPDALFARHSQRFTGIKQLAYGGLVRHLMNRRAEKLRRTEKQAPVAQTLQG